MYRWVRPIGELHTYILIHKIYVHIVYICIHNTHAYVYMYLVTQQHFQEKATDRGGVCFFLWLLLRSHDLRPTFIDAPIIFWVSARNSLRMALPELFHCVLLWSIGTGIAQIAQRLCFLCRVLKARAFPCVMARERKYLTGHRVEEAFVSV